MNMMIEINQIELCLIKNSEIGSQYMEWIVIMNLKQAIYIKTKFSQRSHSSSNQPHYCFYEFKKNQEA
jgi:hypothetical protein